MRDEEYVTYAHRISSVEERLRSYEILHSPKHLVMERTPNGMVLQDSYERMAARMVQEKETKMNAKG